MLKKSIANIGHSLTVRIFLITALMLGAACTATYAFLAWATPISYTSIVSSELEEQTLNLVHDLQKSTLKDCGSILDRFISETGATITITDQYGSPLDLPASIQVTYEKAPEEAVDTIKASDQMTYERDSEKTEIEVNVVTVKSASVTSFPFSFQEDETVYLLLTSLTTKAVNQATEAMGQVLPYLFLAVLSISLLGSYIYSHYITRPIIRLSRISQKMADLDFSWSCGEARGDEIGLLGRNLNVLSKRLSTALRELKSANEALQHDIDRERELERQRSAFFSTASHELKTPITILKGQISGMLAGIDIYRDRDKYLSKSLAAANRMEGLVQEILTVSRMERADFVLKQMPVDLSAMIKGQLEFLENLTEQQNQTLITELEPNLVIPGDPFLLEQAVSNLLNNASLHAPEGARVQVRLAEGTLGPVLTITNSDSQIPKDCLPHLFEAFYRVDASHNRATGGSGLGLYLVKTILDCHGAEYRIENEGKGVCVCVCFGRC